ncbi:type III secretion system apparatus protein VscT2 [Shewanella waksmanii]|uniref:type III secretion system apparatus protein VscT2 n=1 Tax=Shewanella waksmanii TaxID=213783 RepID=UPI003734DA45
MLLNWAVFAAAFLFLSIYNPTRLYLDRITSIAIALFCSFFVTYNEFDHGDDWLFVIKVVIFAFYASVPYWISSMVGAVVQQLLLLNDQSVQDKRFTDESEALSKMSSILFLGFALEYGVLFEPLLNVFYVEQVKLERLSFERLFYYIVDNLILLALVSAKYIIVILCIAMACGFLDLFFKKASLSISISTDMKTLALVILINLWFLNDMYYVFNLFGLG